jgi:hypothetical protein
MSTESRLRERVTTDLVSFIEIYLRAEVTDHHVDLHSIHCAMIDLIDYAWQRGLTPVVIAPIAHAKSTVATATMLWALVHDQRLRLRLVSASRELATRGTSNIRDVLTSARFQKDFPGINPSRPWSPDSLTLERASESRDATLIASGIGTATVGTRVDLLVCDDIDSELSSYSESERRRVAFSYKTKLRPRLSDFGRALLIATRQAPDDVVGQILRDASQLREHAVLVLSIPTTGPQRASRVDCRTILPPPHGGLHHTFGWAACRAVPVPDLPDVDAPTADSVLDGEVCDAPA